MDATFHKLMPLYEGEKYDGNFEEKRKIREAKAKKLITSDPWKPSQPMKQSSGLGDYYGCVGEKNKHIGGGAEANRLKKGDVTFGQPNITTNPSKKGTYGTKGTTLGERLGAGGAVGEYSYVTEPYDQARKSAMGSAKAAREMMKGDPWKPASPAKRGKAGVPGTTLGGKGGGVCGEYIYKEVKAFDREQSTKFPVAFVPSHPARSGLYSTINKFPVHIADPLDEKIKEAKAKKKAEMDKLEGKEPFRPSAFPKGKATVSVLAKNLDLVQ